MKEKALEEFLQLIERIDTGKTGNPSGQNIADAIRPVFFETGHEEFLYATHGGTLFLVEYDGKPYGIACQHVFQDFPCERLFVANEKFSKKGSTPTPLKGFYNPSAPRDGAVGTDIIDLCVIEFGDEVTPATFGGSAYIINERTIATPVEGHSLLVAGVLKEKTTLLAPDIKIGYCRLQYLDAGVGTSDPFLRSGIAEFATQEFTSITGISGSPVYDVSRERLGGMAMRGGIEERRSSIHYLDISDIEKALRAIRSGAMETFYTKGLLIPAKAI